MASNILWRTNALTIFLSSINFTENRLIIVQKLCYFLTRLFFLLEYLLENFYILEGTLYPCPTLGQVLSSRLSTSVFFLQETLKDLDTVKKGSQNSNSGLTTCLSDAYHEWELLERQSSQKYYFYLSTFNESFSID